jgi:hypothetical protein
LHLAEVSLARQSRKMPEEDQKQIALDKISKLDRLSFQIYDS